MPAVIDASGSRATGNMRALYYAGIDLLMTIRNSHLFGAYEGAAMSRRKHDAYTHTRVRRIV